jgi:hypothetical protein
MTLSSRAGLGNRRLLHGHACRAHVQPGGIARAYAEHWPDRCAGYFHSCRSRPDHGIGGSVSPAAALRLSAVSSERRADVLWDRPCRSVSPRGVLRRRQPQGREVGRPPGADAKHELVINLKTLPGRSALARRCPAGSAADRQPESLAAGRKVASSGRFPINSRSPAGIYPDVAARLQLPEFTSHFVKEGPFRPTIRQKACL